MIERYSKLEGTWEIKATTFPMWLSGKRKQPRITYKLTNKTRVEFLDIVEYEVKGHTKKIRGLDCLKKGRFIWRGLGLLKILSSQWEVVTMKDDILIIRFEKSLLTPSGIDILVRKGKNITDFQDKVEYTYENIGLRAEEKVKIKWIEKNI